MKLKHYVAAQRLCLCEPVALNAFLARAQEDSPDSVGDDYMEMVYPPRPPLEIDEAAGIAVIPVVGLIAKGLSVFEQRYFGLCDTGRIAAMVDEVAAMPGIETVFFRIDSPGGYHTGVPELAEKIAALTATKKTVAYTDSMCASAAYWLAAQCGYIDMATSADIGCIGTYCTYTDLSCMAEKMGIKVQVFASGKYKGMGIPGTSLTKDQSALLQEQVEKLNVNFRASILAMRPDISDDAMQGQTFFGDEAVGLGLADGTAPDFDSCKKMRS